MITKHKLVCLAAVLSALIASAAEKPPNIVFILADDMGWADLPCYGNRFNEAPNLSWLAEEGMRFTDAYAACPVCSPTRASILSGQYPARIGVIDFIPGHWRPYEKVTVPKNRTQHLPGEIITMQESMQKAGYRTGYFGKWHLGYAEDQLPSAQGADESYVFCNYDYYAPEFIPELRPALKGRLSEVLTDLSVDFIEKNQEQPFFLFLAHYDVHVQLDGDRDLIEKYLKKEKPDGYPGNAVYAAMVEHVDRSVGRVLQALDRFGLADNTVVFFFSDNGGLISRFDNVPLIADRSLDVYAHSPLKYIATSNLPLRSEKGTVYEGGIREPLIVRWPQKIARGAVCEVPVSSVDFYPTLLELAGTAAPANQVLDGVSILPALRGKSLDAERPLFWHYPVYHHGVPAGAVRKGDWKLVENQEDGSLELYNLRADINESTDVKELYPQKATALYALLKNWQNDVGAQLPVPNPDFNAEKRDEWGRHPDRK
ncbi:sulfatase [Tichowtungia aerotolerans]|uniref:Sulfatase-like hydrolase/transferase n=1 Tax=Tichowtungia aerotolerans TaxID=2697043 RepID=A0A6P1M6Z4_9BACT|nr:sulfatase [Tichowtungia aerotolerans]QHI69792.1 sulfatase-like hydrolase/transferase [Tichowtungia aerotolerans]